MPSSVIAFNCAPILSNSWMISNCGFGSDKIYSNKALFSSADEKNGSGVFPLPNNVFLASVNLANNELVLRFDDKFVVVVTKFVTNWLVTVGRRRGLLSSVGLFIDCIDDEFEGGSGAVIIVVIGLVVIVIGVSVGKRFSFAEEFVLLSFDGWIECLKIIWWNLVFEKITINEIRVQIHTWNNPYQSTRFLCDSKYIFKTRKIWL